MSRPGVMRPAGFAKHLLAAALLWAALSGPAQADVSFSFFYSNLGPHGSWLVSAEYGRVWRPGVYAAGWHPYYDGHWVYSDLGWAWVSDYAWGAIPYHYGTWVLDPYLGWVWVPGYVWAPAWVVFRTGPDHIGWCPVPVGYSVGASFSFGDIPAGRFVFVGTRDFLAPRIRVHAVPRSRTKVVLARTKIVNRITVRNDVVVNHGPDVRIVEKARGRRIEALPIERVERIAPGRSIRRENLRVDPEERRSGLRAVEPRSAKAPAPSARSARPGRGEAARSPERRRQEERQDLTSPERSSRARRDATVRRGDSTGERSVDKQAAPKRKPESRQGAKPEEKAKKKPEKKPPDRKPKDPEAPRGGGRHGPR